MAEAMNTIDIANGIVFQKLGVSKDAFDDRLICQKKIYLLQSLGTDLGYSYNWYVRGPYSPALTTYVYNNLDVLSTCSFDEIRLNDQAQRNIMTVNKLREERPDDLSVSLWYELLASILYISKNSKSWRNDGSDESLSKELIKMKPRFTMQHCECALASLRRAGFCE